MAGSVRHADDLRRAADLPVDADGPPDADGRGDGPRRHVPREHGPWRHGPCRLFRYPALRRPCRHAGDGRRGRQSPGQRRALGEVRLLQPVVPQPAAHRRRLPGAVLRSLRDGARRRFPERGVRRLAGVSRRPYPCAAGDASLAGCLLAVGAGRKSHRSWKNVCLLNNERPATPARPPLSASTLPVSHNAAAGREPSPHCAAWPCLRRRSWPRNTHSTRITPWSWRRAWSPESPRVRR